RKRRRPLRQRPNWQPNASGCAASPRAVPETRRELDAAQTERARLRLALEDRAAEARALSAELEAANRASAISDSRLLDCSSTLTSNPDVRHAKPAKLPSRDLAAEAAALRRAKEFYAEQLRAAQDARQTMQDELSRLQTVLAAQAEQMGGESDHLRVRLAELEAQMLSERQYWLDKLERIKAEIVEREALLEASMTERAARCRRLWTSRPTSWPGSGRLSTSWPTLCAKPNWKAERQAAALAEREAALEAAETERATLGARVAHLDGQAAAAAVELEAARAELAESARQLDSARFDGAARGAELETTQAELAEAEVQLAASREEKRALDARINELRDNMGWVQENFSKMRADLTARAAELAHAESLRADLANELALARDNLAQQEAALTAAVTERDEARAQLAALAEESAGLRADLANLRAKLEAAELSAMQSQAEVGELKTALSDARRQIAELSTVQDRYAELVEAHENLRAEGASREAALAEKLAQREAAHAAESGAMTEELRQLSAALWQKRANETGEEVAQLRRELEAAVADRAEAAKNLAEARARADAEAAELSVRAASAKERADRLEAQLAEAQNWRTQNRALHAELERAKGRAPTAWRAPKLSSGSTPRRFKRLWPHARPAASVRLTICERAENQLLDALASRGQLQEQLESALGNAGRLAGMTRRQPPVSSAK
uniref:TPR_MLP1_2 domain-containing protein n=1 Tax=Macrostomum lignano TaxID=282301 RepID=A0A1I8FHZ7_9PLAT